MFPIDVGNNVACFTEIGIKPLTNMTKKLLLTFALLCAFAQGAWAQNYDVWNGTPTMHYVGNMPNFDFPFPDE